MRGMALFCVRNATRENALVADKVEIADTWWARFKGLLGRASIGASEGLHIVPCNSIHMFFMRFPIDVAFLDGEGKLVKAVHGIKPWRATRMYLEAHSALELAPGTLSRCGVQEGDRLRFDEQG
jgi:uncharacterized membrane protein (UPF0127 family)